MTFLFRNGFSLKIINMWVTYFWVKVQYMFKHIVVSA